MEKGRTHASYKSLYRVKPVLFNVGDIRLPFPVSVEMALIFGVIFAFYYILVVKILGPVLESIGLVPWILSLGLAVLSTWLTTRFDAAGKFIPKYLFDAATFLVRRKTFSLVGAVRVPRKKHKCIWKVEVGK